MSGGRPRFAGAEVRAVLLDYGSTLVEVHRPDAAIDRAYERIAARLRELYPGGRIPPARSLRAGVHDRVEGVVEAHASSGSLREIDLGPVYRQAYADLLGEPVDAGWVAELVAIEQRAWFAGIVPRPETPTTLRRLRAAGLRLGICSNAPYLSSGIRGQMAANGVAELVDSITLSAEVGWRKPAPRLFERALADLGAAAATTVMVGDRVREDVEGALRLGMGAVWLRAEAADRPLPPGAATVDTLAEVPPLLGA